MKKFLDSEFKIGGRHVMNRVQISFLAESTSSWWKCSSSFSIMGSSLISSIPFTAVQNWFRHIWSKLCYFLFWDHHCGGHACQKSTLMALLLKIVWFMEDVLSADHQSSPFCRLGWPWTVRLALKITTINIFFFQFGCVLTRYYHMGRKYKKTWGLI